MRHTYKKALTLLLLVIIMIVSGCSKQSTISVDQTTKDVTIFVPYELLAGTNCVKEKTVESFLDKRNELYQTYLNEGVDLEVVQNFFGICKDDLDEHNLKVSEQGVCVTIDQKHYQEMITYFNEQIKQMKQGGLIISKDHTQIDVKLNKEDLKRYEDSMEQLKAYLSISICTSLQVVQVLNGTDHPQTTLTIYNLEDGSIMYGYYDSISMQ